MLPNKNYTPDDFVRIASHRAPLLLVPTVVGVLIALLYSAQLPNVYEAETLLQIVPQRVPDAFVRSTVTIRTEDRLEALSQQVQSRTQLERMIRELDLYAADRALQPMQDIVERMRGSITMALVRPARNQPADAFYLRFKYGDPTMAARVTERLGTLYVEYNARERGELAQGTNQFLETQLAEAKNRLEAQDKKLQAFRERHSGRLPSQQQANMQAIDSTRMQRQSLGESLARDRDRKLMLERLYNDARNEPTLLRQTGSTSPQDAAAADASLTPEQQLVAARLQLTRLEQRLKENHPDVRRARSQVAELEKIVASNTNPQSPAESVGLTAEELHRRERNNAMRAEIESLDRQIAFKEREERRLDATISDYQSRVEAVPGVESEWMALSRDYDTLQTSFRDLLTKSESARVSADLENRQIGEQFRVLDAPRVPLRPISPQRILISGSGLGAGLAVGLLLVGFFELRDGSFKTGVEVSRVLNLPVVAVLPSILSTDDLKRIRQRRWLASGVATVLVCGAGYAVWTFRLWRFVA
jgi:polysaccharide chain length determinant protein (PEP-CTERM system associated)